MKSYQGSGMVWLYFNIYWTGVFGVGEKQSEDEGAEGRPGGRGFTLATL